MKLIRKIVSIHQSAQQFGFSSSAGYMLIIVVMGIFPIHIWNLLHSRELIKIEEKHKKKKKKPMTFKIQHNIFNFLPSLMPTRM